MAIRVAIKHKTTYHYDRPVSLSPHIFRLRPAVHSRTPIEAYSFKIEPKEHFINWQQDPFGNYQAGYCLVVVLAINIMSQALPKPDPNIAAMLLMLLMFVFSAGISAVLTFCS